MNHLVVTRVSIGIAILCVICALGFAALRAEDTPEAGKHEPAQAVEHPGAGLYKTYCGGCHAIEHLLGPLRGPEPDKARQQMLDFLRKHGKSDDAQDKLIVDYLARSASLNP